RRHDLPSFPTRRSSDLRLFRGHVSGRADHDPGACARGCGDRARLTAAGATLQEFGETKIGELRVSVLRHEDVVRLDIAVENPGVDRKSTRLNSSHLGIS